jgi:Tol biopolymer transport system component
MTALRERDVRIAAFLEDGPAELSPRLAQAIREDAGRTSQRASRRAWRVPTMSRPILVLVPLAALLLIGGALALGVGGARPVGPASAPASSPVATAPAAVASPSSSAASTSSDAPPASAFPIAAGEAWIAYESQKRQVRLVRPDGTGDHALWSDTASQSAPDWSPDGARLVISRDLGYAAELWEFNADGTGAHRLTDAMESCASSGACALLTWPRWSPDGRSIAYVRTAVDNARFVSNSISVLDVATGASRVIVTSTADEFRIPAWSPDGSRLVFERETFNNVVTDTVPRSTSLELVDVAGGDPAPIPGAPALLGHPDWSADGTRIVARSNPWYDGVLLDPSTGTAIVTLAPDGSGVQTVLTSPKGGAILRGTGWTPAGDRILYQSLDPGTGVSQLRSVAADGSGDRLATGSTPIDGDEPALRPMP